MGLKHGIDGKIHKDEYGGMEVHGRDNRNMHHVLTWRAPWYRSNASFDTMAVPTEKTVKHVRTTNF
jgi:hypothetical protein